MTKIFTPEKIVKYAETRLFGSNVTPEMVRKIELHNGMLPFALENLLIERYNGHLKVRQENGREPIYFMEDILFIPQYSGFGRRKRYETMIKAYLEASGRDIKFESHELEDEQRKTNIEYDNFAYDFVVGLFVPEEKYEDRRVFEGAEAGDITEVVFGPVEAVAKQAKVLEQGNSEYLDAQIVRIDNKRILNIGYVYADQAGILIDKMLREYEALARKKGKKLKIDLYMFGRVGGLEKGMQRHQLVYPTGIIDEADLNDKRIGVYPMHNVLAENRRHTGLNFNVSSAIDETVEQLQKAREHKCICVEMETKETTISINRARGRYRGQLDINFGFIGHVSDLPLQGDTLADELDSEEGEQAAVKKIIKAVGG